VQEWGERQLCCVDGKMGSGEAWAQWGVGLHPTGRARQTASSAALCMTPMPCIGSHEGPAAQCVWGISRALAAIQGTESF